MTTTEQQRTAASARAAYMRAYRAAKPDKAARARDVAAARSRALSRLVDLHPDDMRRLYDAELQAAGLR